MNSKLLFISLFFLLIMGCNGEGNQRSTENTSNEQLVTVDFTIAFGSCNDQTEENILWKEVVKNTPDLWIWGGDNIYSDTEDMAKMQQDYQDQINQKDYHLIRDHIEVIGTWDDHDYGTNDGGNEYTKRAESQDLFLDFMQVDKNDSRRARNGVYNSKICSTEHGSIKAILLDTRYFRDAIVKVDGVYKKNPNGTILGEEQWQWFANELQNSTADFNIVMSSIQVLSSEHRFEKWANFPNEVKRLEELVKNSNAKGVILLSGDRHISEFSSLALDGMNYPLIDFTSSGLTHSYTDFAGEPNSRRVQNVVNDLSFGLLQFDFQNKRVSFQMRGRNNALLQEYIQTYP